MGLITPASPVRLFIGMIPNRTTPFDDVRRPFVESIFVRESMPRSHSSTRDKASSRALEGKSSGDAFIVRITPEEGYGLRHESLTQVVSKDLFEGAEDLQAGMQFEAQTNAGKQLLSIIRIEGNDVTIDGNHPLAGETLNFDVTIRGVRDATDEELSHGHAHGPDSDH